MRLFVTGGAGFIGSALVRMALAGEADVEILNFDALTYAGNLENLESVADDPRYELVHEDLCNACSRLASGRTVRP